MITASCECGARYRVPDDSAGKKARCKKCGAGFRVPAVEASGPAGDIDALSALAAGDEVDDPGLRPAPEFTVAAHIPMAIDAPVGVASVPENALPPGTWAGYFQAILRTPRMLTESNNAATFVVMWFLLAITLVLAWAPCIGSVGIAIIRGWYLGFLFRVIGNSAANEDDLPAMHATDGVVQDVIVPTFKMLSVFLLARIPAIGFVVASLGQSGTMTTQDLVETCILLAVGMDQAVLAMPLQYAVITGGLIALGYLYMPMMLLIVALGSVADLVRIDLIGKTIIASLPAYLCTAGIVILAGVVGALADFGLDKIAEQSGGAGNLVPSLGLSAVGMGISLFLTIIAMRTIGLYYHYFKNRFAWSWG